MTQGQIQLGKNKVTEKIIVLKSAGHEKTQVKKYSDEILNSLGKNYTAKVIGFTIFLKRWRRARR